MDNGELVDLCPSKAKFKRHAKNLEEMQDKVEV